MPVPASGDEAGRSGGRPDGRPAGRPPLVLPRRAPARRRPARDVDAGRTGRPPAIVWWLVLLSLLTSLSSALVLPVYLGFDEPQHVDMVIALGAGDGWPAPGERQMTVGVGLSSNLYYGKQMRGRPLQVALTRVPPRDERPSLPALGTGPGVGGNPNQIVQHPPLYYAVVALAVRVVGADDWAYDRLVLLMRAVTALLVCPLPLLVWAMARRLGAPGRIPTAAAALSLAVPGMSRVTGLVNNDGLLIITTAGLLLALVHVATGRTGARFAVVVGLLTGATLLSKGFALAYPVLVVLAYVLGLARNRGSRLSGLLPGLSVALVVGFVSGGFWWIRNLALYGALQPSGFGAAATARIAGPPRGPDEPVLLDVYLTALHLRLARTFWGGVGAAADPTASRSGGTVLFVLLLLSVLVALALGVGRSRRRGLLVLLVLPLPLSLAIMVQGSLAHFVEFNRLPGLQGRYLYAAVPGLAVLTAVGWHHLLGPARRLLLPLAVTATLALQALHGRRLVRELWLPPGGGTLRDALAGLEVVAPWPDAATEAVFAATVATAAVVLVLALASVRDAPRMTAPRHAAREQVAATAPA